MSFLIGSRYAFTPKPMFITELFGPCFTVTAAVQPQICCKKASKLQEHDAGRSQDFLTKLARRSAAIASYAGGPALTAVHGALRAAQLAGYT
eukprot:6203303-Pleurochrysis_carterae.AAC.3